MNETLCFMQGASTKMIRISFYDDVNPLISEFSEPVTSLCSVSAEDDMKDAIYSVFEYAHSHGEWFYPDKELLDFIAILPRSHESFILFVLKTIQNKRKPSPVVA